MSSHTAVPKYHVVCRECATELLSDDDEKALTLQRKHAENTGHRIALGRI
jgi:hypothetical protein